MWPFKSVSTLRKSGMFEGFTDWHSHILPGVDDGIKTLEDSLAVLRQYEELGFSHVWLTPHIMEDYPNKPADLKKRFDELRDAWTGKVTIALAAEHMLDALFEERFKHQDILPIGSKGNHILVETSYFNPPFDMNGTIDKILKAGFFPVLAHPERYRYMGEKDYIGLKQKGVLFQGNFASAVGGYGETARKKIEWMLGEGMLDMVGSDVHRLASIQKMIELAPKKGDTLRRLVDVARNAPEI